MFTKIHPIGSLGKVYWVYSGKIHARLRVKYKNIKGKIKTLRCGSAIPDDKAFFIQEINSNGIVGISNDYKQVTYYQLGVHNENI